MTHRLHHLFDHASALPGGFDDLTDVFASA